MLAPPRSARVHCRCSLTTSPFCLLLCSIILVHDVEICSDEEVPLQIANYEDTIAGEHNGCSRLLFCDSRVSSPPGLQADLAKTEAALKMVLQDQGAGITPSFVESVMHFITDINETIERAMSE